MFLRAKERMPITSPRLLEAYSTKIEWVQKIIPKLEKEEAGEKSA
jgi:hypothetical protein